MLDLMAGMKIVFVFGQSIQREHFLLLERTPLQTPSVSSLSSDSGFDTVF